MIGIAAKRNSRKGRLLLELVAIATAALILATHPQPSRSPIGQPHADGLDTGP